MNLAVALDSLLSISEQGQLPRVFEPIGPDEDPLIDPGRSILAVVVLSEPHQFELPDAARLVLEHGNAMAIEDGQS